MVLLMHGLKAWLRYWRSLAWWQGRSFRPPFDPVGEIPQPIVTGPNRIPFFTEESSDDGRQEVVANRKERKEWGRRLQSEDPGLEVVHPHAAGIDVSNSAHYVAVRPERDPEPVRRFECLTADLYRLADWLKSCRVTV